MAEGKSVSQFKPPRIFRLWHFLLLAAIVAGVMIASRPAYRMVKAWRARNLVAGVNDLAKDRKWQEAFTKAQAAYLLASSDPVVNRAVGHLYSLLGQAQAFPFWATVLDSGTATIEDRREMLALAMKLERTELAEPQLLVLLKTFPDEAALLRDAAELYGRKGDIPKAVSYCRSASEKSPNDNGLRLLLARLLLSSTSDAERKEGQGILQTLARGPDKTALDALLIMKDLAGLSSPERVFVIGRLMSHPLAGLEHQLWACQAKLVQNPEQRDEVVDALLRRYPDPTREQRLTLGQWLNSVREPARALKLVPVERIGDDREYLLIHLNALGILGRWDQVGTLLERGAKFEPWLEDLFKARVAMEQGKTSEADLHWIKLHQDIPDRPGAMMFAAQYAEKIGRLDDARKLFARLSSNPSMLKEASAAQIRMAEPSQDTREVLAMLQERIKKFPKDPSNQNDISYLNLLLGENIETSRETAEKLYSESTNILSFRTTLALAHLRQNRPAEALKLVDLPQVPWEGEAVLPGWRAIHAAVLGANGKTNEARKLAKGIPTARLRAEEKALLRPWL